MAGNRLERIGTIYSRTNGLLKTGAMKTEDLPIWFKIYEKFPPKLEPRFDRSIPNITIKNIFYEEDKIRSKFQTNNKNLGIYNLNTTSLTKTQSFLEIYNDLKNKEDNDVEVLYKKALEIFNASENSKEDSNSESESLSELFKQAKQKKELQSNENKKLDINKILT